MDKRGRQRISRKLVELETVKYCCDSDSLINLQKAGLLSKLRFLVQDGIIKIPSKVYQELKDSTDILSRTLIKWKEKYPLVVELDTNALEVYTQIQRKYGRQFSIKSITYSGLWATRSGQKSTDSSVIALAKSRGWIVISDDSSVRGACMLEDVACHPWEEIGRLLKPQSSLPGF